MNVEYNLGLVAGSLACLRPLLAAIGVVKTGQSDKSNGQDGLKSSHELTTIGGGPKWRKLGRRGASSRVQGESVLCTQMTAGHKLDNVDVSQADLGSGLEESGVWHQDPHGSTDRIVHSSELQTNCSV